MEYWAKTGRWLNRNDCNCTFMKTFIISASYDYDSSNSKIYIHICDQQKHLFLDVTFRHEGHVYIMPFSFSCRFISYTVQCEHTFLSKWWVWSLKYSTLNKCLDKSKHLSKRYSRKLKVTKTGFSWTDDEIQLLLESVNQYKCKPEYEPINWESVR